jgi:choline monooxygenase
VLGGMKDRMGWIPAGDLVFSGYSRDYPVDAHWALYCENYLEGFHIPYVHHGLNAAIDFGQYATELYPWGVLQVAIAKEDGDCFDLPASSPDHGKKIAAYYFFVFPNLMLNFYPWGLSVNIVRPVSKERSVVSFLSYIRDAGRLNRGAGADLDVVEMEDEEVVRSVQRGIRSRFYRHGRYSVTREQGVHHFHRLVAAAMKGGY